MADVRLTWDDNNELEEGYYIYRSSEPMDASNMPPPIASVDSNSTMFIDTGLTVGETWYYRVGAYSNGMVKISSEEMVVVDNVQYVYSGSMDNTVKKINSGDGLVSWTYTGHTNDIFSVVSDDVGNVYSGGKDLTVRKLDSNGNLLWSFNGHTYFSVYGIDVASDGYVYSCGRDGVVRKVDPNGSQVWVYTGIGSAVAAVIVGHDESYILASGSYQSNYSINKIDLNGNEIWTYSFGNRVMNMCQDSNGNTFAGSYNYTLRKVDVDGGLVWSVSTSGIGMGVAYDEQSNSLYVLFHNSTLRKYDAFDGSEIWSVNHPYTDDADGMGDIGIDNSGFVYAGTSTGEVRKYDSNGNIVWINTDHSDWVICTYVGK